MNEKDLAFRVSKHIKEFRTNTSTGKKMSQSVAADVLGISLSSLKRYENGESTPSENYARDMEKKTGIIHPYWMGETDCKTWEEWQAEQEQSEHDGLVAYDRMEDENREQKRILFSRCGYRYEYLDMAQYDFAPILPGADMESLYKSYHPHQLTRFSEPDKHYYFSQAEIDALILKLQEVIDFTCYKADKAKEESTHEKRKRD